MYNKHFILRHLIGEKREKKYHNDVGLVQDMDLDTVSQTNFDA